MLENKERRTAWVWTLWNLNHILARARDHSVSWLWHSVGSMYWSYEPVRDRSTSTGLRQNATPRGAEARDRLYAGREPPMAAQVYKYNKQGYYFPQPRMHESVTRAKNMLVCTHALINQEDVSCVHTHEHACAR